MQTLIVKIDTPEHAKNLATYLRKAKGVKSVKKENDFNWINPSRPANAAEVEALIAKSERDIENSNYLSSEEARAMTLEKISRWKKKKGRK